MNKCIPGATFIFSMNEANIVLTSFYTEKTNKVYFDPTKSCIEPTGEVAQMIAGSNTEDVLNKIIQDVLGGKI